MSIDSDCGITLNIYYNVLPRTEVIGTYRQNGQSLHLQNTFKEFQIKFSYLYYLIFQSERLAIVSGKAGLSIKI